jgi:Ca-activated chloride channel homolog
MRHQFFYMRYRLLLFCSFILLVGARTEAQSDSEEVHIAPRPQSSVAADNVTNPLWSTHTKSFKVDVDLVLVPVTVTDQMNRLVTGLDKSNFQVYENKQLQTVQHFSNVDAPISIGIIFDTSGSMVSKIERARQAIIEFLKTANPQDEFFLITFNDAPAETVDFTDSVEEVQNKLIFAVPKGRTALLDAVYLGINKMQKAKYPRKAVLIISDGGDNHSRYTEHELTGAIKEADVTLYAIGIYDHYFPTEEERLGPALLTEISELTGGRTFTIDNPNDLADTATKISVELRNQYLLGYRPQNPAHDGKWHKIRVKLTLPRGFPPLQARAKQGYYASSD